MRLTLVLGRSFTTNVPKDDRRHAAHTAASINLHGTESGTLHVSQDFFLESRNVAFLVGGVARLLGSASKFSNLSRDWLLRRLFPQEHRGVFGRIFRAVAVTSLFELFEFFEVRDLVAD